MNVKDQLETLLSDSFLKDMIGIRRHLHQFPERSFKEHNTSAYIRRILDKWGIEYKFPFVETGILARIKGNHPGKCIALRSDMDALPITEKTELEFQVSATGDHACLWSRCAYDLFARSHKNS